MGEPLLDLGSPVLVDDPEFYLAGLMGTCPLRGKILGVLVERYRGIPPSRDAGRTLARDTSSVENTGGREYPLAEMLRGAGGVCVFS